MLLRHLYLTAHGNTLTGIYAMRQRVLHEHLTALAFSVQSYNLFCFAHHKCLFPEFYCFR